MLPLGCLFALDFEDTFLKIRPNSHRWSYYGRGKIKYKNHLLQLKRGQVVFWHPLLCHAGFGYGAKVHRRMHGYLFHPLHQHLLLSEDGKSLGTFSYKEESFEIRDDKPIEIKRTQQKCDRGGLSVKQRKKNIKLAKIERLSNVSTRH